MPLTLEDKAAIADFKDLFDAGKIKGEFPGSLLGQYADRGSLSEKQMYWVRKLVAENSGATEGTTTSVSKQANAEVVDCDELLQIFAKATHSKLAYPKIHYKYSDIGCLTVFQSNNNRDLIFSERESRTRLGWLDASTKQYHTTKAAAIGSEMYRRIRAIIAHPIQEAVLSGKELGNCMFCGKGLINEFSVTHGYGPICAENWGLPWQATYNKTTQLDIGLDDFLKGEQ